MLYTYTKNENGSARCRISLIQGLAEQTLPFSQNKDRSKPSNIDGAPPLTRAQLGWLRTLSKKLKITKLLGFSRLDAFQSAETIITIATVSWWARFALPTS